MKGTKNENGNLFLHKFFFGMLISISYIANTTRQEGMCEEICETIPFQSISIHPFASHGEGERGRRGGGGEMRDLINFFQF